MKTGQRKGQMRFLRQFLQEPGTVGSVAPSSTALARAMLNGQDLSEGVVMEIGPGTGALTAYFLKQLGPKAQFVAVERNGEFVTHLRELFPGQHIIHGNAKHAPSILSKLGLPPANAILSSLPWASFDEETQRELLNAVFEALAPGGFFSTFGYYGLTWLPRGRRFNRLLHERFARVDKSHIVWRNVPPAFAYLCRKDA